jgi:FkbM family methyltransferase
MISKFYNRLISKLHPHTIGEKVNLKITSKIRLIIFEILFKLLTLFNTNPIIETRLLHGKPFKINAKHALLEMKIQWPFYDTSLTELSNFLSNLFGEFTSIDIGANVGDSCLNIREGSTGSILCIEPSLKFHNILIQNRDILEPIKTLNSFVGEKGKSAQFVEVLDRGTAIATSVSISKETTPTMTLEEIVEQFPEFANCKLIKIDTDGWDISVLKSAKKILSEARPFVFFEYMPELIIQNGDEYPLRFIEILLEMKYYHLIIYDGYGYLYGKVDLRNENEYLSFLQLFTKCTSKLSPFWLDILASHVSYGNEIDSFYRSEESRIQ